MLIRTPHCTLAIQHVFLVTQSSFARITVPTHTRWLKVCPILKRSHPHERDHLSPQRVDTVTEQDVFHDCEEFIPEWLNFVKDLVDHEDLSLQSGSVFRRNGVCNLTRTVHVHVSLKDAYVLAVAGRQTVAAHLRKGRVAKLHTGRWHSFYEEPSGVPPGS